MSLLLFSTDDTSTPVDDSLTPGSEAWARELISQQWLTAWPVESLAAVGVEVTGILEDEPLPAEDTFAMCSFAPSTSRQMTQGAHPRLEYRGFVFVKIWTPAGVGGQDNSKLADAARRVFTRKSLSSGALVQALTTLTSATPQRETDGRWKMQLLSFPCTWYEQQ